MSKRYAFGHEAEAQARFYEPAGRPLLVVSGENIAQALKKAVALREQGEQFDAAFVLREQQTVHALIFGKEILRFSHDFDQRRNAFELLVRNQLEFNKKKQADLGKLSAPVGKTLSDIAALATRWVVGSWMEYRRIEAMLGVRRPAMREARLDENIPRVAPDANADALVVWAPERTPESLAVVLFALEEFRRPAYVVCRPGPTYGLKTILVQPSESERALSRAALIVDASVDTPSAALSFLQQGVRVVATRQSGAAEYAPHMRTYDPWARRSVFAAIAAALGEETPAFSFPAVRRPRSAAGVRKRSHAKVSLIVRTFDRPQFLDRALHSVQTQTHPNVEAVVVNNGGDTAIVAEICRRFDRARMITIPRSGIAVAATRGLEAATGTYCGLLDDDDVLFPEHAERLCAAIQRSGVRAAYADAMNIYLRRLGKNIAVAGYAAVLVPAIEPSTTLWICQVVGSSRMLFDREWVLRSGGFHEEFEPADDYEVWLRIVQESDIVRVPAITSLYTQFLDKTSNMSVASGPKYVSAHKAIYQAYPTDRAAVRARRESFLLQIQQQGGLGQHPVPLTLDPQPLLF